MTGEIRQAAQGETTVSTRSAIALNVTVGVIVSQLSVLCVGSQAGHAPTPDAVAFESGGLSRTRLPIISRSTWAKRAAHSELAHAASRILNQRVVHTKETVCWPNRFTAWRRRSSSCA